MERFPLNLFVAGSDNLAGIPSIVFGLFGMALFVNKLKEEISEYEHRLAIKPGITGLAQVWHRYDETIEDVKKKVKYDLLYIKKMCLFADIVIIFRTLLVVITGKGAR